MPALKKSPLFVVALLLLALVAVGEGGLIVQRISEMRTAEKKWVQKRAALAELATVGPVPSRETAAQIEADLARAQRALTAMQTELQGRGAAAERFKSAKPPGARTDAFFDLATFIENSRNRARQFGVNVQPAAAHFGFSLYANEGPETALIAPVFHQRLVVQYLVDALLEARPRALVSVQRERPLTDDERKARTEALAAAAAAGPADAAAIPGTENYGVLSADYFALDPRLSASAPGIVEVTAFRLVFTGQTAALRAFLNKLAGFELPVIVRAVEVEPATGEEAAMTAVAAETPAPAPASMVLSVSAPPKAKPPTVAPLVPKALSKFTVVVEFIDLLPPPAAPSAAPASS